MKKLFRLSLFIFMVAALSAYVLDRMEVPYREEIDVFSEAYHVDKALVYAMAKAESGFQTNAVSKKGAVGLMQLMPDTAAWCAEKLGEPQIAEQLTEPAVNIRLGTYYLSYLLKRYGGEETAAIAAYNAGDGRVDGWLENPDYSPDGKKLLSSPYPETDRYIKKVALYQKLYRVLYR